MSTLKKAIIKFRCRFRHAKECLHNTSEASSKSAVISTSSSSEVPLGDGGEPLSKNQQRKQAKKERQIAKAKANEQRKESVEKRREAEDERAAKEEPRQLRARYGSKYSVRHMSRADMQLTGSSGGMEMIDHL